MYNVTNFGRPIMAGHQLAHRPLRRQPRFLTIPLELRNEIYAQHVTTSFEVNHHPQGTGLGTISTEHSLLLVNTQISNEYLEFICREYSHKITVMRKQCLQKDFSIAISPHMRSNIRWLRLFFKHSRGLHSERTDAGFGIERGPYTTPAELYAPGDKTVLLHHLSTFISSFLRLRSIRVFWEGLDWHPEHEVRVLMTTIKALPEAESGVICTRRNFEADALQGVFLGLSRKEVGADWHEEFKLEVYDSPSTAGYFGSSHTVKIKGGLEAVRKMGDQ